jgi:two-component system chemotaxis response regulator CheY
VDAIEAHRILIVDDDVDIRDALQDLLQRKGYIVTTARDGREALESLRSVAARPCLILLDLMMPGMSGWEFLTELDGCDSLAGLTVVVMSACRDIPAGRPAIKKPFSMKQITELVEQLCAQDRCSMSAA